MANFESLAANSDYFEYLEKCKNMPQASIELSSICNFKCYYCQHPNLKREKKFITDEMFYYITDQLLDFCKGSMGVNWAGEATLHPNFFKYCKYINDRGLKVALPTNGSTLSERFLDIDLSWIQIYLDIDEASFARRGAGDYVAHMARIKGYTKAWLASGSRTLLRYFLPTPKMEVGASSKKDIREDFVHSFLHDIGLPSDTVDFGSRIIFSHTNSSGGKLNLGQMPIISGGIFPETPDNPAPVFKHEDRNHGFCDSCWKTFKLTVDGRMTLCCQSLEGNTIFSKPEDIRHSSILDVWKTHPEIERFRENMRQGKLIYNCCKQCLDVFPKRELYVPANLQYTKPVPGYRLGDSVTATEMASSGYAYEGFSPLIVSSQIWTMAPAGKLSFTIDQIDLDSKYTLQFDGVFRSSVDKSDRECLEVFINDELLLRSTPNDGQINYYKMDVSGRTLALKSPIEVLFKVSSRPEGYLALSPARLARHGFRSMCLIEKCAL